MKLKFLSVLASTLVLLIFQDALMAQPCGWTVKYTTLSGLNGTPSRARKIVFNDIVVLDWCCGGCVPPQGSISSGDVPAQGPDDVRIEAFGGYSPACASWPVRIEKIVDSVRYAVYINNVRDGDIWITPLTSSSPSTVIITKPAMDTTVFISKYETSIVTLTAKSSRPGGMSWNPSSSITVSDLYDRLHSANKDTTITVTVTFTPTCGKPSAATRKITVKAKPLIEHYCQGNAAWKAKWYDTFLKLDSNGNIIEPKDTMKIGGVGCALTCMAMVLKTLG